MPSVLLGWLFPFKQLSRCACACRLWLFRRMNEYSTLYEAVTGRYRKNGNAKVPCMSHFLLDAKLAAADALDMALHALPADKGCTGFRVSPTNGPAINI